MFDRLFLCYSNYLILSIHIYIFLSFFLSFFLSLNMPIKKKIITKIITLHWKITLFKTYRIYLKIIGIQHAHRICLVLACQRYCVGRPRAHSPKSKPCLFDKRQKADAVTHRRESRQLGSRKSACDLRRTCWHT